MTAIFGLLLIVSGFTLAEFRRYVLACAFVVAGLAAMLWPHWL